MGGTFWIGPYEGIEKDKVQLEVGWNVADVQAALWHVEWHFKGMGTFPLQKCLPQLMADIHSWNDHSIKSLFNIEVSMVSYY